MRKIAYIEIDTHAEIAQNFIEVMEDSKEFAVDYYFSEKIYKQIRKEKNAIFLSDSSMILDQLKLKKYDLIIIGTVHRYFNTFQVIAKKYQTFIIAHNLNFIKASKMNIMKSVFQEDVIFRLKLWWKEGLYYFSKPYHDAKGLLVLDEELASDKYTLLPVFYNRYTERVARNKQLHIVIPGSVSQKRRDYEHVFKIIQNITSSSFFTFVFLGKAKGHELMQLQKISTDLPKNIEILYFSERVSQQDFDFWMKKADILWCPIQSQAVFFSQQEKYGETKMTGNLGDAIKFGKLAVFPSFYQSKLDFIIPEQENVIQQFEELKNASFDFQESYKYSIVKEKLEKIVDTLISI
ncbi:hypothetical protein D1632_14760 [Chryseobacterium nematophagum]|uniref:Glycosyltransferase family 1 protein n=1 Tax=Chryseobacterium nematophagum TaxID=2305228 RepID=A0A3M7L894_9FLAO|nr:hypothetical protein [Chryseobacterium nematophagum]RMZ58837.1 hypothetical protein D1632_14760 [Chryseobacterium nematophagum]